MCVCVCVCGLSDTYRQTHVKERETIGWPKRLMKHIPNLLPLKTTNLKDS